ncbi:MAG: hypothetical protein QOJ09_2949 [Actinomycetota bacterium]|nr:hypothetical protein [Actinomycetota bacterium]
MTDDHDRGAPGPGIVGRTTPAGHQGDQKQGNGYGAHGL